MTTRQALVLRLVCTAVEDQLEELGGQPELGGDWLVGLPTVLADHLLSSAAFDEGGAVVGCEGGALHAAGLPGSVVAALAIGVHILGKHGPPTCSQIPSR